MKKLFILLFALTASKAEAGFQFTNLDKTEVEQIFEELTTANTFTTISGAGGLGTLFGFEVGLLGGESTANKIQGLVKEADPGSDYNGKLYHGGLIGRVTVPLGITVEMSYLPELKTSDAKFKSTAFAVNWNFSSGLLLDLSARAHMSNMEFSFSQTGASASFENNITGLQLLASKNFIIAEPYVGLGIVQSSGDLSITGTSFLASASQSESAKVSGTHIVLGSEFKLLVIKLGIEYAKIIDDNRTSAKLSFYF